MCQMTGGGRSVADSSNRIDYPADKVRVIVAKSHDCVHNRPTATKSVATSNGLIENPIGKLQSMHGVTDIWVLIEVRNFADTVGSVGVGNL